MKKLLPILSIFLLCAWGPCATVQPGHDALLVNSERAAVAAHTTFDTLFNLERLNEAYLIAHAPAVHKAVNALRSRPGVKGIAETAEDNTWAAIRVYAEFKSPQNTSELDKAMAALKELLAQASSYMAQMPKKGL